MLEAGFQQKWESLKRLASIRRKEFNVEDKITSLSFKRCKMSPFDSKRSRVVPSKEVSGVTLRRALNERLLHVRCQFSSNAETIVIDLCNHRYVIVPDRRS